MVLPQRIAAEETFQLVPPMLAASATAYQRACAAEHTQLALMGERDLLNEWSDDVRSTVLLARQRIREADVARAQVRDRIRDFVGQLRNAGEPPASVLRYTRSMIQVLESTRATQADGGRLASEILTWALEDCETH